MKISAKKIAVIGLLTAIEILLSRVLAIPTPIVKLSLAFIPTAIIAELYGPLWAGFAAAAADFIGALILPTGPYFFGFTLTAFLTGVVFGLFLYGRKARALYSVMAAATVCLVLNLGLDTLWLQIFMNKGILALLPTRAVKCIVMLPLEAAGLWMLRKNRDTWFKSQTDAIAAEYRARARGILKGNPKMREVQSERICSAVTSLEEFKNAKTVFCFVGTDREIDTSLIIKKCFEEKKTLCVPRCEKGNELTARRINLLSELKLGKFGLLEPDEHSQIVDKSDIDFSVIPASAVDLSLHRMGKGGGFYDRYLSDSGDMYKVAVCPSQLCVAALLATENDVPMDAVVTENKIRRKMKNKSKTARIHEQT